MTQTSWICKQIRTLARIVQVLRLSVLLFPLMYGNPTKHYSFWSCTEWSETFLLSWYFSPVSLHKMLRTQVSYLVHVLAKFLKGNYNYGCCEISHDIFSLQATSCCQYFHSLPLTVIKGKGYKHWKQSLVLSGSSPNLNMAFLMCAHLLPLRNADSKVASNMNESGK